jgi:hypothetical protein
MTRPGESASVSPLGLGEPGLRVDGATYAECKRLAGWGTSGNGLDPSPLTERQRDFCGVHVQPPPATPGWQSVAVLEDTSDEIAQYDEPRSNIALEVDSELLRALTAIGPDRSRS